MFENKIALTGIKPTGTPHIGNLVGAIKPILQMTQEASKSYIFVADLHSLNAIRDKTLIKKYTYEVAATFLALGLDTNKAVLFRQSDIPEIYQLNTLLMNVTAKGLMNRAHAYKASVDKNLESERDPDAGINMGLFTYPILMAADILLYGSDVVPVGKDQKQHVEFARDICGSFNNSYEKEVLVTPEPVIQEMANAIPGLDGRKMSKSYDNTIPIFHEEKPLRKLIMKIITDSKLPEEPKEPNDSTIYQLYCNFANAEQIATMRNAFEQGGMGYGDAKNLLFEAINSQMQEPREKYKQLIEQPKQIEEVLQKGAEQARYAAIKTMRKVKKAMLGRE